MCRSSGRGCTVIHAPGLQAHRGCTGDAGYARCRVLRTRATLLRLTERAVRRMDESHVFPPGRPKAKCAPSVLTPATPSRLRSLGRAEGPLRLAAARTAITPSKEAGGHIHKDWISNIHLPGAQGTDPTMVIQPAKRSWGLSPLITSEQARNVAVKGRPRRAMLQSLPLGPKDWPGQLRCSGASRPPHQAVAALRLQAFKVMVWHRAGQQADFAQQQQLESPQCGLQHLAVLEASTWTTLRRCRTGRCGSSRASNSISSSFQ